MDTTTKQTTKDEREIDRMREERLQAVLDLLATYGDSAVMQEITAHFQVSAIQAKDENEPARAEAFTRFAEMADELADALEEEGL